MKFTLVTLFVLAASAIMSFVTKPPANPIQGLPLYVNPHSQVAEWIRNHQTDLPDQAEKLAYIAEQPQASWFNGSQQDMQFLHTLIASSTSQNSVPVIVLYNLPFRDCGLYSAGGAVRENDYKAWINEVVNIIDGSKAIIIVEPDALSGLDCLPPEGQSERYDLLNYASHLLSQNKNARVYLDAGHPIWQTAEEMAVRLKKAGIDNVQGFSLNVSNFFKTQDVVEYGTKISQMVNNKTFVVDTSRNGNGPTETYDWCNPSGRALGVAPTTTPKTPFVDAFLWVKLPGESDGFCNGGPKAGEFWPDYALQLFPM